MKWRLKLCLSAGVLLLVINVSRADDYDSLRSHSVIIRGGWLSSQNLKHFSNQYNRIPFAFRVSGSEWYQLATAQTKEYGAWGILLSGEYALDEQWSVGMTLSDAGWIIGKETEENGFAYIPYDIFDWRERMKMIGLFAIVNFQPRISRLTSLRFSVGAGPYFVSDSYSIQQFNRPDMQHSVALPVYFAKYALLGIDFLLKKRGAAILGFFVQYIAMPQVTVPGFVAPAHITPYSLPPYDAELVFQPRPMNYSDIHIGMQLSWMIDLRR